MDFSLQICFFSQKSKVLSVACSVRLSALLAFPWTRTSVISQSDSAIDDMHYIQYPFLATARNSVQCLLAANANRHKGEKPKL